MSQLLAKPAPDFTAQAVMPDGTIEPEYRLRDLKGQHVLLFFYPLDFTFVCPTEILEFDRQLAEFEKRGVQVVGVSVDSQFSHLAWRTTPIEKGGIGEIGYPLVSDLTKQISRDYGVLAEETGVAYRGTFLIDKEGVVRHMLVNDVGLGRNIGEALRMVDALQHLERYGEVCPANWQEGEAAMQPTSEGVAEYLSEHQA